jgi:hypothetical protein
VLAIEFRQAFYIKLGPKGAWEEDSLNSGRLRFGWSGQDIQDINAKQWGLIAEQLRTEHHGKPSQVATTDFHRLQDIADSGPDDIWITFSQAKLWWARLRDDLVQQDKLSKFRHTADAWSDKAINGRLLFASELPGKVSQLQGFRGTVCRVRYPDLLKRILIGARSPLAESLSVQRSGLSRRIAEAIRELHWKDYETLVDLVFRNSGWVRIGVLGQHAKAYDLELREPITENRYVVQVKSRAKRADLLATAEQFSPNDYSRVFFIVHSPSKDLEGAFDIPEHVELVPPSRLADLVVDAGLIAWVEDKAW